ncbi:unnamed protein product, partial [Mycena citricolor]
DFVFTQIHVSMTAWASSRCKKLLPRILGQDRRHNSSRVDIHAFSDSLLLPKTNFALRPNVSEIESRVGDRTCSDLYKWQVDQKQRPEFVLHDGPPYANGELHMGHALNKITKDIINRFQLLRGSRVRYTPGWDCHGLPIENKALTELGADSTSLSALAIRQAAHNTALREIEVQKAQFQRLGIMADWSDENTYRTIDHSYQMRQLRIFQSMVENELIYRRYRPVYFSPSSRSALAEAELVYKDDHVSHSVYVTFRIDSQSCARLAVDSAELLVWTTTPWTLTANMGVAVNPELTYAVVKRMDEGPLLVIAKDRLDALSNVVGQVEIVKELQGMQFSSRITFLTEFSPGSELVGISYMPIFSLDLPALHIIPASHVTASSGTGLVHCAPAHGVEDYNSFRELGLLRGESDIVCHVGSAGEFTAQVKEVVGAAGDALIGEAVLDGGSRKVVELLREAGALLKIQRYKHRYPYDWRTGMPVITTSTSQWFANLDAIKEDSLRALQDVEFVPEISRSRLMAFITLRSEWCISRQRVWGVPIPALHHISTDKAVLDSGTLDHILSVLDKKGIEYWWEGPVDEFVPPALQEDGVPIAQVWRKGTDTMDVWFDSGAAWSMLPVRKEGSIPRADVCLEGSDQHRGWFQSQLLTAIASAPSGDKRVSPYRTLITHGMVLDQHGRKMSKSLGNVMSPMAVVKGGVNLKKEPAYGADVLRFWVGTVDYRNDVALGPTVLAQAAEAVRKIRNSARFILGNIGSLEDRAGMDRVQREDLPLMERYVMHKLYLMEQTAVEGYSEYNFAKVVAALSDFANVTLSSLYFDISKDGLYANALNSFERRATVTVLEQVLSTMTYIMAPVVPHLAEEIHEELTANTTSVFKTCWESLAPDWLDPVAGSEVAQFLKLRSNVLAALEKARGDKNIKSSLEAEVEILVPDDAQPAAFLELLRREEPFLKTLFITSDASLVDEGSLGTSIPDWVYLSAFNIPGSDEQLTIRVRPAQLEKCSRCWTFTQPAGDVLCPRCLSVVKVDV